MERQRLALVPIVAPVVAALLASAFALTQPGRVAAIESETLSISVDVGAARTLPSGSYAYNDVCNAGYNGTEEDRCAVEFNLSGILSSAQILSADLRFSKTGGCGTQDCPVELAFYTGDGSPSTGDVTAGTFYRDFTPGFAVNSFLIPDKIQEKVSDGADWFGVRLSRSSKATRNPDVQSFSYDSFKLSLTFIQRPVDLTLHLAGSGTGTVNSNPSSIECPGACSGTFEWLEPVSLFASATNGSFFSHWEGGECDGSTEETCSFDMPPTDPDITAFFDPPIGPPISAPPGATPKPSPTQLTPPPLPTAQPTGGPGPIVTLPPAPTDVIASDGTVITPPPPPPTQAAVGASVAPTIVGLDDGSAGEAGSSGGIGLPIVILLIIVLGGIVGGGVYWYTKRRQDALPPPQA